MRRAYIGRFEDALLADEDLSDAEKVSALAIVKYLMRQSNICMASFETLADFRGAKRRSFIRHEKTLVANGWFAKLLGDGGRMPDDDRGLSYTRYRLTNWYCINPDKVPKENVQKTKRLRRKQVSRMTPLEESTNDRRGVDEPADLGVSSIAEGVSSIASRGVTDDTQTYCYKPADEKPAEGAGRRFATFQDTNNQLGQIKRQITDGTVDVITAVAEIHAMSEWAHEGIRHDMKRRDFLVELARIYADLDKLQNGEQHDGR